MNMRIAAILLLGYCAGMSTPAFAQKKDKLKKRPQHLLEHFREERQCQNHLSEYRSAYKYLSTERNRYQRCIQCCTKRL
mgnify:FL=1